MKNSTQPNTKRALVLAMASLAFAGCMTQTSTSSDYTPDGGNVIITQETQSMGQVIKASGSGLAKTASADSDSATGESHVTRSPATCPDSISGLSNPCFVRDAQFAFTNSNGVTFTRERKDTVWLDSTGTGNYLSTWNPLHAAKIIHHRHVSKVKGDVDVEIQFNTVLTWTLDSLGAKTMATWTGTIVGTYNGVEFKNVTITGVKRPFTASGGFGSPTDGDIKCDRGNFSVDIQFQGDGKVQADVTNKKNGRKHHVELNGGKEVQDN